MQRTLHLQDRHLQTKHRRAQPGRHFVLGKSGGLVFHLIGVDSLMYVFSHSTNSWVGWQISLAIASDLQIAHQAPYLNLLKQK
jgi:hypothetical protein